MTRQLRPDKRQAITGAARKVFGRDGYARAGIDAIAAEAGVSTRTIYNHFDGKEQLFSTVIEESATSVADAQADLLDRHLTKIVDLEADLVAFARDWARPKEEFAEHFRMVAHIAVEAAHFPEAALETWREAGPRRVTREFAGHLRRLADAGHLSVDDPELASDHFTLLTASVVGRHRRDHEVDEAEFTRLIESGVRVFLAGYGR